MAQKNRTARRGARNATAGMERGVVWLARGPAIASVPISYTRVDGVSGGVKRGGPCKRACGKKELDLARDGVGREREGGLSLHSRRNHGMIFLY